MKGNELIKKQKDISAAAVAILSQGNVRKSLWEDFTKYVLPKANFVLDNVVELKLPPVKPSWADLTDAGPGVGVSNFEVKFWDAKLVCMHKSDYRIRVHRSCGDSGQNKAERMNSAIGDSVVDGGTIDWNFYKRFDDLTDQEIAEITPQGFEPTRKVVCPKMHGEWQRWSGRE